MPQNKIEKKDWSFMYCSKTQHTWSAYLFTFGYVHGGMGRLFGRHDCMHGMLKNFRICMASILRRNFNLKNQTFTLQMDKDNRLYNRIEPFAALFWALGIVLAHILQ